MDILLIFIHEARGQKFLLKELHTEAGRLWIGGLDTWKFKKTTSVETERG